MATAPATNADLRAGVVEDIPHVATAATDEHGNEIEAMRVHVKMDVTPEAWRSLPCLCQFSQINLCLSMMLSIR